MRKGIKEEIQTEKRFLLGGGVVRDSHGEGKEEVMTSVSSAPLFWPFLVSHFLCSSIMMAEEQMSMPNHGRKYLCDKS